MRHSNTLAVIAGILACALVHVESAHAGDVYKYVDDRGMTMYTDKPIPGAIKVSSAAPRPMEATRSTSSQAAQNSQLAASNQRIAEQQTNARVAATVAKDLEATRAERCKKARDDYTQVINTRRLYRTETDGSRSYLNEAELASARVEAAKNVEAICGPQG
jgi:hypothetical protein